MSTSSVSIEHTDYTRMLPIWKKVRDTMSEEAVKLGRETYLPRLTSMKEPHPEARAEYENYLLRAALYGAMPRTLAGLSGTVLRKEPSIEGVPDAVSDDLRDAAGRDYEPLTQLMSQCVGELASLGRCAVMVDNGSDPEAVPYILVIEPESVVYWRTEPINGRETPVIVVISETYDEPFPGDLIGNRTTQRQQWRVLRLADAGALPSYLESVADLFAGAQGLVYWQEIWRETDKKLAMHSVVVPTKRGGRFWSEIPCDIVNAMTGVSQDVEDPPMLPLANVVLAHYRNSADYEWGLHLTATPQPWASGFDVPEGARLVTGCGYAWVTPQTGADVQYLEFGGAGLGQIEKAMAAKEQQMAILGARMLESPKMGAEAMGTVRLRQSGERSVLACIANSASTAMTRAVQRWLAWQSTAFDMGTPASSEVVVRINTDFDAMPLDPAELTALVGALQAGTISWETFAHNVRRGELLPPGVTDEEERKRIQAGAPGRSRKEELAMLQADAREGRITVPVYLEQVQKLGMLDGVDVASLIAELEQERARGQEMQMMILRQAEAEQKPPDQQDEPQPDPAQEEQPADV